MHRATLACLLTASAMLFVGCKTTPENTGVSDDAKAAMRTGPQNTADDVQPGATRVFRGPNVQFYRTLDPFEAEGQEGVFIKGTSTRVFLKDQPFLDQQAIATAAAIKAPEADTWYVQVNFTDEGSRTIETVTQAARGQQIAIAINGEVVVAPKVRQPISKSAYIAGRFSEAEAKSLAGSLNRQ